MMSGSAAPHGVNITERRERLWGCYNAPKSRGGNSGGGDMNDELERRVRHLESDVSEIKFSLTALTARSDSFATKADVAEGKSELKCDIANLKIEFGEAMDKRFDKIMGEMNRRFDKVDENTKWRLSGIIMPVCIAVFTSFFTSAATYFIAKFVG